MLLKNIETLKNETAANSQKNKYEYCRRERNKLTVTISNRPRITRSISLFLYYTDIDINSCLSHNEGRIKNVWLVMMINKCYGTYLVIIDSSIRTSVINDL